MIKRGIATLSFAAFGLAAACVSTAAFARVNVGVYVGTPGPVYAAPPVVYAPPPPPPVVYAPQPAYGYGYYRRGWHHDHWRHREWERHHGRGW